MKNLNAQGHHVDLKNICEKAKNSGSLRGISQKNFVYIVECTNIYNSQLQLTCIIYC